MKERFTMKTAASLIAVLGLASAANAGLSLADLSLGTIGAGDSVMGDTFGAADNMNGTAGFGSGAWSGGEDVYTLAWGGGDLVLDLLFTNDDGDFDLFLWADAAATVAVANSLSVDDNEQIAVAGLAAGTYYVHIDGWLGATNTYKLQDNGVPAPASAALLGLGGLVATRRRRA